MSYQAPEKGTRDGAGGSKLKIVLRIEPKSKALWNPNPKTLWPILYGFSIWDHRYGPEGRL